MTSITSTHRPANNKFLLAIMSLQLDKLVFGQEQRVEPHNGEASSCQYKCTKSPGINRTFHRNYMVRQSKSALHYNETRSSLWFIWNNSFWQVPIFQGLHTKSIGIPVGKVMPGVHTYYLYCSYLTVHN